MRRARTTSVLIAIAVVAVACGGGGSDDDASTTTAPSATVGSSAPAATSTTEAVPETDDSAATTSTSAPAATTAPSTTGPGAGGELPEGVERTDWLTAANGVVVASFTGDDDAVSAGTALRAIDGAPQQIGFARDTSAPSVYVFELPAETVFDEFAVPDTTNSPGNTTFFASMTIEGSNESADSGFEVLVSADFEELPDDVDAARYEPLARPPVRWIRLTLSGALRTEPEHDPGRTIVRFSELVGNGEQATVALSTGFDGVWSLKFADNPGGSGDPTELRQVGAVVSGCIGFADVEGTVTGNVARLIGVDSRNERPSLYLLSLDTDGELRGVESTNNGVFRARVGPTEPEGTTTRCSQEPPSSLACGSIVYVNFDLDSAVIRPDSAQILDDLAGALAALPAGGVTIVGHTSTEGSDEYNLALSERRADAVRAALVERGADSESLTAQGRGESDPLVSETDEASRALNRRVEVVCASG